MVTPRTTKMSSFDTPHGCRRVSKGGPPARYSLAYHFWTEPPWQPLVSEHPKRGIDEGESDLGADNRWRCRDHTADIGPEYLVYSPRGRDSPCHQQNLLSSQASTSPTQPEGGRNTMAGTDQVVNGKDKFQVRSAGAFIPVFTLRPVQTLQGLEFAVGKKAGMGGRL